MTEEPRLPRTCGLSIFSECGVSTPLCRNMKTLKRASNTPAAHSHYAGASDGLAVVGADFFHRPACASFFAARIAGGRGFSRDIKARPKYFFLSRALSARNGRLSHTLALHFIALFLVLSFLAYPPAFAQHAAPANSAANNSIALPAAWANWKYSRAINLPPNLINGLPANPASDSPSASSSASGDRLVKLRLPAGIFAHAQPDLADLRIIDDRGAQTPYVLRIASGRTQTAIVGSRRLESSYVPGQYTQIILDAGPRAPFYNSLELAAPLQNFAAWARVEASDDAHTWRRLAAPQPIYRFAQKNNASQLTLDFSPTNARYLRLRIFYKPAKFEVTRVTIRHAISIPREDVSVATISDAGAAQQNGRTILHADLGYQLPVDRVRITSSITDFDRTVQIYSSDDDAHWNWTGYGEINAFASRLPPSPPSMEAPAAGAPYVLPDANLADTSGDQRHNRYAISLSFNASRDVTEHYDRLACNFASRPARYWRVEIVNGNDAPLPNASAQLSFAARDVFFRAEPGRSYSLIYGQSMLHGAPYYDLSRTLTDAQMNSAAAGQTSVAAVQTPPAFAQKPAAPSAQTPAASGQKAAGGTAQTAIRANAQAPVGDNAQSAAAAPAQTALGPERVNSAWVDPRPWTERHSIVLWLAVILAALALTLLAIQSLKGSAPRHDAPPPANS